nr:hypothetical protein [uncultured Methanoregula sp.]
MTLLLQKGPQSRAGIADATGYSERQVRRVVKDLLKDRIVAIKDGRRILYKLAAATTSSPPSTTTTITPVPEQGHLAREGGEGGHNCGKMSTMATLNVHNGQLEHEGGHFSTEIKTDSTPILKPTGKRHRQPSTEPLIAPGCLDCPPGDSHKCRSCPLSYVELEHDAIQFVVVDQEFRDRLVEEATLKQWRRKTDRGLTWIYRKNITLQVGGDVVVFYSDEPGDMSGISAWVRGNFTGIYTDIDSLVSRIKHPHELSRDELTIVIRDPATMEAVRPSLRMKMDKTGTFFLKSPNSNTPGFKAYYRDNTLRCEFDCRDEARKISGLWMRRRLLQIIPSIANAPGIFDEFLTDYYNPYEHPILIDTGGHEFLAALENLTSQFTGLMRDAMAGRQPAPVQETPIAAATREVEKIEEFDIEQILLAFRRTLKLNEEAVRTYLIAYGIWQQRGCGARVLKEDVLARSRAQNEPLSLKQIADAIEDLKGANLMMNDERLEIKFSPEGIAIARKLLAKWEGA